MAAEAPGTPAPVVPAAETLPSAEMLLYFAEFEDAGDFVDPLALESAEARELGVAASTMPRKEPPKDKGKEVDEQAPRTH